MAETCVVNASPLILLDGGGLLSILKGSFSNVLVPQEVSREVLRGPVSGDLSILLTSPSWILTKDAPPPPDSILVWDLGPGETAVLSYALRHAGVTAVVDDLLARRCANSLGLPISGTLGMVLAAKQRGEIRSAREVLETLRQNGMHLSDRVMNRALALVGE